jgi:hypothetical protein
MEYKKKADKNTKAGKYFLARTRGLNKTEALKEAGASVRNSPEIEATKTYQAFEDKYRDILGAEITLKETAQEHVKNIKQDKDKGAKNKAIDMKYRIDGAYPKEEMGLSSGDVIITLKKEE